MTNENEILEVIFDELAKSSITATSERKYLQHVSKEILTAIRPYLNQSDQLPTGLVKVWEGKTWFLKTSQKLLWKSDDDGEMKHIEVYIREGKE